MVTRDEASFLYLGSAEAFVIPADGVVEGDYARFVEALRDRIASVHAEEMD